MSQRSTVLIVGTTSPDLGEVPDIAISVRKRLDEAMVRQLLGKPVNHQSRKLWETLFRNGASTLAQSGRRVTAIVIDALVWKHWAGSRRFLLPLLRMLYPQAHIMHPRPDGRLCMETVVTTA